MSGRGKGRTAIGSDTGVEVISRSAGAGSRGLRNIKGHLRMADACNSQHKTGGKRRKPSFFAE